MCGYSFYDHYPIAIDDAFSAIFVFVQQKQSPPVVYIGTSYSFCII